MNKCYIIVLWDKGIPHFYQNNNKVAWSFEHCVKPYMKLGSAEKAAKKLCAKYRNDKVCIYHINYSATYSSCDFVQGKYDKDLVSSVRDFVVQSKNNKDLVLP